MGNTLTGEEYLDFLSNNVIEIRKRLGWSQLELCERLGISRPTISGIENGSGKLSKTVAYALYSCVFGEIAVRRLRVQAMDYTVWEDSTKRNVFIKQLNKILWNDENNTFNWGVILGTAAGAGADAALRFVPLIGALVPISIPVAIISAAIVFAFPKKAKDDSVTTSDQVKSLAIKTVEILESEVLVLFGLNTLNIAEYVVRTENMIKHLRTAESQALLSKGFSESQP